MRLVNPALLLLMLSGGVGAQAASAVHLSDYVGTYADAPGHTLEIVDGDGLFAVVDEAKYPLHPSGVDRFTTISGQTVTFLRNAQGKVAGYEQDGMSHPRVSPSISVESAALARPRPVGQDKPSEYRYHIPVDLHDGLAVETIARSGLGLATAYAIGRQILDGTFKDVHGVLLYQHGKLVMEEYFYGYNVRRTHQLRSATKSIVSALAGIAIDRGALSGVDERVLPEMPYANYANPDRRKAAITLGDFLSMSSGLDCNDHSSTSPGRETVIDNASDWVKATLDLPMISDPGTKGSYCSGGVSVVGRLIERAVHMPLPEFAHKNLFEPLGISPADWTWNYELTNANKEFSQIHLRPRDMLKFGVLFLDGGRWHGHQVISSSWVHTALSEHSHVDHVSYGYFWWRPWLNVDAPGGSQHVDVIAAQGNGGQKIYLVPQYDFVAVFTAGGYNAASTPPNTIMAKIILPALMMSGRGRSDPARPAE